MSKFMKQSECKIIKLIDRIDNLCELDWSDNFAQVYAKESRLLLDVLRGIDQDLENELDGLITAIILPCLKEVLILQTQFHLVQIS